MEAAKVGVMHLENGKKSHKPKNAGSRMPLETGKGKETESSLEPPEGT